MSLNILKDIKSAYAHLNPEDVRDMSQRVISVGLVTSGPESYTAMERLLSPVNLGVLQPVSNTSGPAQFDLIFCEPGLVCPENAFVLPLQRSEQAIEQVLEKHQELEISLARNFLAFRQPVIHRIIQRTSKENAMFSLVTALPNVVPNFLELPWAVGEFATDTAFLTMNQVRMAFLIAAANGKTVGYGDQKVELATIAAGAFGWRAIARELIGKIPLGGGLIPKAAVSFAGTYVVGLSLERFYRTGIGLDRSARKEAYQIAFERGKGVVQQLFAGLKRSNAA
jgi:hypothetical protein